MVHITTFPECINGDHENCKGNKQVSRGVIGGALCDCWCHKNIEPELRKLAEDLERQQKLPGMVRRPGI
ncbi:MAG: hypothetical protein ACI8V7_000270 [Candidatus Paceibacteria bacterium]|jgi:hypothetical protein